MEPIRTTEKAFVKLREYKGNIELVACHEGKDGTVYEDWGKKKINKTDYNKIDLPISVVLGNPQQAVATLKMLLNALDNEADVPF